MPTREECIEALRDVASSVSVVATDGAAGRHGATVSAFCSVSTDSPKLLVRLRGASRILRTVLVHGQLCLNALEQSADALAERIAGRADTGVPDRFAGLPVVSQASLSPVLGVAARAFSCDVLEAIPSGSHVVVIGRVCDVLSRGERPLTYLDGGYGSIFRQAAATQR